LARPGHALTRPGCSVYIKYLPEQVWGWVRGDGNVCVRVRPHAHIHACWWKGQLEDGRPCILCVDMREPVSVHCIHPKTLLLPLLHSQATPLWLYEHFAPYGGVLSVKLLTDEAGAPRGVGFVNYVDQASASRAVDALHGLPLSGERRLFVSHQVQRPPAGGAAGGAARGAPHPLHEGDGSRMHERSRYAVLPPWPGSAGGDLWQEQAPYDGISSM
jgi:RNA recognition motif-containing protein